LDARIHVAPDNLTVSMFYFDTLPFGARIRVLVNGSAIRDGTGMAVDVDNDGIPGGTFTALFDTVTLNPTPNTFVIGVVFASEQKNVNGTLSDIPLSHVHITGIILL
jgi:hypothetical protein